MNNKADVKQHIGSQSKDVYGHARIQFQIDPSSAICNFASAKPVSAPLAGNMSGQPAIAELRKPMAVDYRPRGAYKNGPTPTQTAARIIRECQIGFGKVMQMIGNPAAVYQARPHNQIGMSKTREATMQVMPFETRNALNHQMSITEFGMRWEPGRQLFYGAGKVFANGDVTQTVPTHDLAHLLIGACGNLQWCPEGGQEEVRLAEYYAVFLENLFDKVYGHFIAGSFTVERVLHEAIEYARWFVDVHYAPFPIPAEEAYRRFCWNLDAEAVVRLSPLFFALKHVERTFPDYRDQTWELHFNTADAPLAEQVAFAEKVGN